jgi:hypothetical protein
MSVCSDPASARPQYDHSKAVHTQDIVLNKSKNKSRKNWILISRFPGSKWPMHALQKSVSVDTVAPWEAAVSGGSIFGQRSQVSCLTSFGDIFPYLKIIILQGDNNFSESKQTSPEARLGRLLPAPFRHPCCHTRDVLSPSWAVISMPNN